MRIGVTSRRSRLLLWALALACAAGVARLGVWQLARMHEKQALLDASHAVLAARIPQPLAIAADPRRAGAYDWAVGSGRFLDAPAILLDNQAHGGRIGVRAYRAFAPLGAGMPPVLVDLGWLPLGGDRRLPVIARPLGERRVAGLLAPPPGAGLALGPARSPAGPEGEQARWLLTRIDLDELSAALNQKLAPRILRLDPALPLGYARDLEVLPNTLPPERHRGYALQWFGLAFATLCTAVFMSLRRPK
jgi:cytochrome oxidase assembly protein ShyY1